MIAAIRWIKHRFIYLRLYWELSLCILRLETCSLMNQKINLNCRIKSYLKKSNNVHQVLTIQGQELTAISKSSNSVSKDALIQIHQQKMQWQEDGPFRMRAVTSIDKAWWVHHFKEFRTLQSYRRHLIKCNMKNYWRSTKRLTWLITSNSLRSSKSRCVTRMNKKDARPKVSHQLILASICLKSCHTCLNTQWSQRIARNHLNLTKCSLANEKIRRLSELRRMLLLLGQASKWWSKQDPTLCLLLRRKVVLQWLQKTCWQRLVNSSVTRTSQKHTVKVNTSKAHKLAITITWSPAGARLQTNLHSFVRVEMHRLEKGHQVKT